MATKTVPTKTAKPTTNPKPAAKPTKPAAKSDVSKALKKVKALKAKAVKLIARAMLESIAKKHGSVTYHGTREKFDGKKVEIVGVRDESRHGYDARVLFSDGVRLYVSPTSLTAK